VKLNGILIRQTPSMAAELLGADRISVGGVEKRNFRLHGEKRLKLRCIE
jgi:hypothetical protein